LFVAASERWGVHKPSPGYFARLVAETGAAPEEIAYVGDRLDNDVLPARSAGLWAIFLRRGPWGHIHATWPEREQAHAQIASLASLKRWYAARRDTGPLTSRPPSGGSARRIAPAQDDDLHAQVLAFPDATIPAQHAAEHHDDQCVEHDRHRPEHDDGWWCDHGGI